MTIDVAVCIIRNGKEFLISQRKADDHFGGYWEFPGGTRETDDASLEACAVREAKEEVGLDVIVESFLMTVENPYKDRSINLHFFLCRSTGLEPRAIECQEVLWVDATALSKYLFPPANSRVIQHLIENFSHADR